MTHATLKINLRICHKIVPFYISKIFFSRGSLNFRLCLSYRYTLYNRGSAMFRPLDRRSSIQVYQPIPYVRRAASGKTYRYIYASITFHLSRVQRGTCNVSRCSRHREYRCSASRTRAVYGHPSFCFCHTTTRNWTEDICIFVCISAPLVYVRTCLAATRTTLTHAKTKKTRMTGYSDRLQPLDLANLDQGINTTITEKLEHLCPISYKN